MHDILTLFAPYLTLLHPRPYNFISTYQKQSFKAKLIHKNVGIHVTNKVGRTDRQIAISFLCHQQNFVVLCYGPVFVCL